MSLDFSVEPPSAKTLAVLRDPSSSCRTAQYIAWHPDGGLHLYNCSVQNVHQVSDEHGSLEFERLWVMSATQFL